jgi:hypothetical protein
MSNENQNEANKGKPYEPPKVIRVSLRPEEAVLGHCKVPGSGGAVSASCASLSCKTFGA